MDSSGATTSGQQAQGSRFLWKRDVKYDLLLLSEVNSRNPFAFNNQKPVWVDVANALKVSDLKMKVTDRSCRERVSELLKNFCKDELASIRTSGASEDELSTLKILLFDVAKLEEFKPTKSLKTLYCRKSRSDGESIRREAIRAEALEGVESPLLRERILEELEMREFEERELAEHGAGANDQQAELLEDLTKDDKDDFEFGPTVSKHGRFDRGVNSKKDMIRYLEKKSEQEILLRKDELRVREIEAANKTKELEMMHQIKEKENEVARMRAEAEIEDRKKNHRFTY